jgi:uncharacterized protein
MGADRDAAGPRRVAVDPELFALADPGAEGGGLRLLCSYGPGAERFFWPRRHRCPVTGGPVEDAELAVRGTLWSWCEIGAPLPGADARAGEGAHRIGVVDLPEGLRVPGILVGGEAAIGSEVSGVAVELRDEAGALFCGLGFRAAGGAR